MLEEFEKYVSKYDLNDENIKLKYNHSLRVMELSEKYALTLGFNEEDVKLAKLIGLLHDFGRFEQLRVYNSYNDRETIDHADYSVEQLFDKGFIRNFTEKQEDYEIIKFAIKYHNKYHLPHVNNERMMKHAKLIRDTDKIDILYLLGFLGELNSKACDEQVSIEVLNGFNNHESIDYKYIKNKNDKLATTFGYVFDIYNVECLPEIKQNLAYFYKQIDGEKYFKEIFEIVNKYIDERIDKNVRY